ncbi:MAG: hypothetical protein MJ066_01610 [Clostridia bacterium]|nr:hypothetical protein [Clostridia bacterium]
MDSKITKKRLSEFLSYEWIFIIIIALAFSCVWGIVFSVSSLKLTVGQEFKYYYDENLDVDGSLSLTGIADKNFSYDIRKVSYETLRKNYNVLTRRLAVYDGDVIFTDTVNDEKNVSRAKTLIDDTEYKIMDYDTLNLKAKKYLSSFLSDEFNEYSEEEKYNLAFDFENLDKDKINANFNKRTNKRIYKNDIRANKISYLDELQRIKTLCKEVEKFQTVIEYGKENGWFFYHKRFETLIESANEYREMYENEQEKNYGFNVGKISDSESRYDISQFVKLEGTTSAENVVLLVFDFSDKQEDLQYESISFINGIVEKCSSLFKDK